MLVNLNFCSAYIHLFWGMEYTSSPPRSELALSSSERESTSIVKSSAVDPRETCWRSPPRSRGDHFMRLRCDSCVSWRCARACVEERRERRGSRMAGVTYRSSFFVALWRMVLMRRFLPSFARKEKEILARCDFLFFAKAKIVNSRFFLSWVMYSLWELEFFEVWRDGRVDDVI